MYRFKLRTLLILLAILPPIGAVTVPPLAKWLTQKPLTPAPAIVRTPTPQFIVYDLGNADPLKAENAVRLKLSSMSRSRLQLTKESGRLAVWGDLSVHKAVRATILGMQDPPRTEN
jgi:hypothetical protein